ncbi:MAG: methyltransferase [Actinobacteria bacterium]|uniref:Unannotated protein n=1 Tax=freshwater metagenome TaxID=449393 RepID=A0A6J5Z355_9ZZZZ|nr:methyltransferase [Actinomycetota bacterium]
MAPTDPRQLAIAKASWDFSEMWIAEDSARATARVRAAEVGCPVVSNGVGSALRMLATAVQASAVVEIGTGAGISALWLLEGMTTDGVLTSIDSEAEHQLIARDTLAESDFQASRVRLINGKVDEVLSRLSESAYDIVLISGRVMELESQIHSAMTLLRSGGLLLIDRALWHDRVADPSARDDETVAMRSALSLLAASENWVCSLLPVGAGLLVCVKK